MSKLLSVLATIALISLQFAAPTPSKADTYKITALDSDAGRFFYGMDDSGHVVLRLDSSFCTPSVSDCYKTFTYGLTTGIGNSAPTYTWDYVAGHCVFPQPMSAPCSITNNGRTATISNNPHESLYVSSGSNPPQLLLIGGFGPIFAIDGLGDIVFDEGNLDTWYEAIDLTTAATPEPASLLLLATGILGGAFVLSRRQLT